MKFKFNSKAVVATVVACTIVAGVAAVGELESEVVTTKVTENLAGITYKPGTYTSVQKGLYGDVKIQVTFSSTAITDIKVLEESETDSITDPAFDKIPSAILENQSLKVDTVTGATYASNAIIAAIEDCVTQAGASVEDLRNVEVVKNEIHEVISTEIVVVGGGASGTAAGLQAAQNGSDVIVVEMTASPAGQATLAGGLFATDSPLQEEAGVETDNKWVYDQFMETGNYQVNSGLLSKIIQMSGSTVEWLMENGVNLILAHPGTGAIYEHVASHPFATLHGYVDGGVAGVSALHQSLVNAGGEVLYNTKATELIIEDGKITGILCETEDGTLQINAEAVVLATGGFGGNADLVEETFGEGFGTSRVGTNIGTGIDFAMAAGADADYDKAITMHYGVSRGGTSFGTVINTALANPYLHVDVDGNRFMNEEAFIFEAIKSSNVIKSLPQNTAYELFDSTLIETVAESGYAGINDLFAGDLATDPTVFIEVGHEVNTADRYAQSHTPTDLTETINKLVEEGKIIKAESAEEMAEKLGMTHLTETIERYNELCENGEDVDHFKSERFLDNLEGTLYAVKITPSVFLGTLGGIEINQNCEVLDEKGKAITGLYAAGAETSGVYGNSYVYFEGGTLGYAYNSGRIAGTSASEYVATVK